MIAVCLFGLYGSASGHWGMLATDAGEGRLALQLLFRRKCYPCLKGAAGP